MCVETSVYIFLSELHHIKHPSSMQDWLYSLQSNQCYSCIIMQILAPGHQEWYTGFVSTISWSIAYSMATKIFRTIYIMKQNIFNIWHYIQQNNFVSLIHYLAWWVCKYYIDLGSSNVSKAIVLSIMYFFILNQIMYQDSCDMLSKVKLNIANHP